MSGLASVLNGLEAILKRDTSCRWVLVHDAARPCLSASRLEKFLEQGLQIIFAIDRHDLVAQIIAYGVQ